MEHFFTRDELYNAVWTDPVQKVAKRLDISDVGLAKVCRAAHIPLPPRGHWARIEAGQSPPKAILPLRFPGQNEQIQIGQTHRAWNDETIPPTVPPEPRYPEALDDLKLRVRKLIGKIPARIALESPDPHVARCLAEDEARIKESQANQYSWKKPQFVAPVARRRLTIVNAIFTVLGRAGCKPQRFRIDADEYSVKVGDSQIAFAIRDATRTKPRFHGEVAPLVSEKLMLEIPRLREELGLKLTWDETTEGKLTQHVGEIANTLIVGAELMHRWWMQERHRHAIQHLAEFHERRRKRELEEQKQAALRREQERQRQIKLLITHAENLQKADTIRNLIDAVLAKRGEHAQDDALCDWEKWARGVADGLDPRLLSLSEFVAMNVGAASSKNS